MGVAEWFKDLFRKKEFYHVNYEILKNEFSIIFKEVSDEDLSKIKDIVFNLNNTNKVQDTKAELYINDALIYENIDELITEIKHIITIDYKDTYFKSKNSGYDFKYFLNSSGGIYKDVLFLSNALTFPNNEDFGNVIYHLLALKKSQNIYYLWNLLDLDA